jgi:hypothetical protein
MPSILPSLFDNFFKSNPELDVVSAAKQKAVAQRAAAKREQVRAKNDPKVNAYIDAARQDNGQDVPENNDETYMDRAMRIATDPYNTAKMAGRESYFQDTTAGRYSKEKTGDALVGVADGFVQGVGSLAALGAGAVNANAGAAVSDVLGGASDLARSLQSDGLKARMRASDARSDQLQEENLIESENRGGGLLSDIRRVGADLVDSFNNAASDDVIFGSGLANAVGSLFSGGVVGKGIRIAATPAAKYIAKTGVRTGAVTAGTARKGLKIADAASMPVAIGLQEGGGAYQQTLMEMIAKGASVEEANKAALMAGTIQSVVGAATGTLVGKFERNPFKRVVDKSGTPSPFRMIGLEGIEEGIQGGSGQAVINYATDNPDALEGVGKNAGEGALFGMAAGAVTQGPAIAGGALSDVVKGTLKGIDAISKRVADNLKTNQDSSVISDVAVKNTVENMRTASPVIKAGILATIADSNATPESKAVSTEYLNKLFKAAQFDMAPFETDASIPDGIKAVMRESVDTYGVIDDLVGIMETMEDPEDLNSVAKILNKVIKDKQDLVSPQAYVDAMGPLDDNDAVIPQMKKIEQFITSFHQTPKVTEALARVKQMDVDQMGMRPIEGDQSAIPTQLEMDAATRLSETDPDKVNPGLSDDLIYHAGEGNIQLTPEQMLRFKGISNVAAASRAGKLRAGELGLENVDAVSSQVLDGKASNLSVIGHMKGIVAAMEGNDPQAATLRLQALRNFAQHMQNKLDGINRDIGEKGKTFFEAYRADGTETYQTQSRITHFTSRNSIISNQQIGIEAGIVADAANSIIEMFPELGVSPVEKVAIDPSLDQNVEDVLKLNIKPTTQPKEDTQTKAEPESEVSDEASKDPETNSNPSTEAAETAQPEGGDTSTVADIQKISNEDLNDELNALMDRGLSDLSRDDKARFKLLKAEEDSRYAAETARIKAEEDLEKTQTEKDQAAENPEQEQTQETEQVEQTSGEKASRTEPDTTADLGQAALDQGERSGDVTPTAMKAVGDAITGLTNWMKTAFKTPEVTRTRFTAGISPMALMKDAVSKAKLLQNLVGEKLKHRLSEKLSQEYAGYLTLGDQVMETLQKRLNDQLSKKFGAKPTSGPDNRQTILERLMSGDEGILTNPQFKALNITQIDENGNIQYDPEYMEKAVLAGLQWAITAGDRIVPMDDEGAAALTGLDEEQAARYTKQINGMSPPDAARSLAETIIRYWGVTINNDMPMGYAQGIAEAVAKEILLSMSQTVMFADTNETMIVLDDVNKRLNVDFPFKVKRWIPGKFLVKQADGFFTPHPIKAFPELIETALIRDPETLSYINEAPQGVPKTQLRNAIPLADQQTKTIANAQRQAHKVNTNMVGFLKAIGSKGALILYGEGDLAGRKLNINHRNSLDGKNRTVAAAYNKLMSVLSEAENIGDLSDAEIFYRYEISRANRLQMQGEYNPQASKLVRETILPTWSNLDLANNPDHKLFFYLALAQAMGVKIDQRTNKDAIKEVTEKLEAMPEMLELLSGDMSKLDDNTATTIRNVLGGGKAVSPVMVHAVMEYARYKNASAAEKADFRTALYLEADGVTNGPANAMMMLTSGEVTEAWIENAKKIGVFFDGTQTMNEHRQTPSGQTDMYGAVGSNLATYLQAALENTNLKSGKGKQMVHVLRLMDLMGLKIELSDKGDTLTISDIDRSVLKNPLTISIYGSGPNGIAGNVTSEILEAMYEKFSAMLSEENSTNAMAMFGEKADGNEALAMQMYDQAYEAVEALTAFRMDREGNVTKARKSVPKRNSQNLDKYTFDEIDFSAMRSNILHTLISPMVTSIKEVLGGNTMDNADLLRKATQLQSIKLKEDFIAEVKDLILRKKEGNEPFKMSDFVSKDELNQILKGLLEKNPYMKGKNQNIFVSGTERMTYKDLNVSALQSKEASDSYIHVSNALSGDFKTPIDARAPANSGVGGIPLSIIALGDGHMIQIIMTMKDGPQDGLPVFDGFHMRLDRIRQDAEKINQAAQEVWKNNPMQLALTAYETFLENHDPLKSDLLELAKSMFGPQVYIDEKTGVMYGSKADEAPEITEGDVFELVAEVLPLLRNAAKSITARQQAIAEFTMTSDQMASVGVPYTSQGVSLEGMTSAEIAEAINNRYLEILAGETETETETVEQAVPEDPKTLSRFGRKKNNVRVYSRNALRMLASKGNMSPEQQEVFREILKTFDLENFRILVGSKEDVSRMIGGSEAEIASRVAEWGTARGHTNYNDGYAAIFDKGGPETMLHEIIHAATFQRIEAYYTNGTGSKEDIAAIKRLEELMEQFLEIDVAFEAPAIRQIFPQVKKIIENYKAKPDAFSQAAALNEFMAYVLANRKLIDLATRTEARTSIVGIVKSALDAIKKFVFGKKHSPKVTESVFSNMLFNTAILLRSEVSLTNMISEGGLNQSAGYGMSDRLVNINVAMSKALARYQVSVPKMKDIGDEAALSEERAGKQKSAFKRAKKMSEMLKNQGFNMDVQEESTFSMLVGTLGTAAVIDPVILTRLQDYYQHATKNLIVENFMSDPDSQNPNDRSIAEGKLNAILGNFGTIYDESDRSALLPNFIALATVSEEFRTVLRKLPEMKGARNTAGGFDAKVENAAVAALEQMALTLTGERGKNGDVVQAMTALVDNMAEIAIDRQSKMDSLLNATGSRIDKGNSWVVSGLRKLSDKGMKFGKDLNDTSNNKYVSLMGKVTEAFSAFLSEENNQGNVGAVVSFLNNTDKLPQIVRDTIADAIGRTDENANVYDMIKLVRGMVQKARQQFRENLPKVINENFSRELQKNELKALFNGLAKTDLAALKALGLKQDEIIELLADDAVRARRIADVEARIRGLDAAHADLLIKKSTDLSEKMMFNQTSNNLLRNADAIAHLPNETTRANRPAPTPELVRAIDELTTLYAMGLLNNNDKSALVSLAQNESKGVTFALSYLYGLRQADIAKSQNTASKVNMYKGYVPSLNQTGASITITSMDAANHARMLEMSYQLIGEYTGSNLDSSIDRLGYYMLPVSARAGFEQGVAQNARPTSGGVDLHSGFTDGLTAGRITDPAEVRAISARISRERGTEKLMPVLNSNYEVIAYERSSDPVITGRIEQNTDLAEMLGVWKGRQIEEAFTNEINTQLVDNLGNMYDEDIGKDSANESQYTDLFSSRDPIIRDAIQLMTPEMRQIVTDRFGRRFMVRNDMINQSIGYRAASVGDAWTGTSRWSPEALKAVKTASIAIWGNDAYKKLIKAETLLQNLVTDAKVIIVVKSVIVPMANFASNMLQLMARGVPAKFVIKMVPRVIAEIDGYVRSNQRLMNAEAELGAVENDLVARRRLLTEIRSIKDGHRRLMIWPLVQAGEFNSISDVSISREDYLLSSGRLSQYMETLADRLPESMKTLGKYGVMSRDTALFKGLQRSIEYGDFIGKVVRYEDLKRRERKSDKEALAGITEEFVNFDYLPGRARGGLERYGMMWFWNFKIRSMKIGLSIIRNNPLHAFMSQLVPIDGLPGGVGSVMTDNGLSIFFRGDAGWSIGPGMGINSPFMHPTVSVTS